jgi:hypothetical protein
MENKDRINEEIVKRLNVLISLTLEQLSSEKALSITKKIHKLADLNVSPADIAKILNKPLNYITAILSQRKPRGKEGNRNG